MSERRAPYRAARVVLPAASEQQEQEWLFDAIRAHTPLYPALRLAFHSPNEGQHHVAYRQRQVRMGLRPGVPDLLLPCRRQTSAGARCGLAVELKVGKGRASAAQRWWLDALAAEGWETHVCQGWQAAWEVVLAYVQWPAPGE